MTLSQPGIVPPAHVVKRDGQRAAFDACKIEAALARAGAATGEYATNTSRGPTGASAPMPTRAIRRAA